MSTQTFAPAPEDLEAYRATELARDVTTLRHTGHDRIVFAKGDPDLIVGMAVVKAGTFNGTFDVTPDMLHVWVDRFEALRGVFRPPHRIDHSYSVLDVIGRYEALRVEERPDDTIGGAMVPMLVGDLRLVGTAKEKQQTREWIEGDKLNERSSEFWSYRTNTGVEYPSVFAGCAFVDIPAVEGLGAITLRRATLSATDDTPEGSSMGTEQNSTTDETQSTVVETPVADAVETPPAADAAPDGQLVIGDADADQDEDEDEGPPTGEVPPAVDLRSAAATILRSRGVEGADLEAALRQLDDEVDRRANLRVETDTRLAKHTAAGVIPLELRPTVEALLRHDDQAVRDGIDKVLSAARPPVRLNGAPITRSSESPVGERTTIALDATPEEVADIWSAATPEQRVALRREYDAWQSAQTQQ